MISHSVSMSELLEYATDDELLARRKDLMAMADDIDQFRALLSSPENAEDVILGFKEKLEETKYLLAEVDNLNSIIDDVSNFVTGIENLQLREILSQAEKIKSRIHSYKWNTPIY